MDQKVFASLIAFNSFSIYPMDTTTSKIDLEARRECYKKIRTNLSKANSLDANFINKDRLNTSGFEDALLASDAFFVLGLLNFFRLNYLNNRTLPLDFFSKNINI